MTEKWCIKSYSIVILAALSWLSTSPAPAQLLRKNDDFLLFERSTLTFESNFFRLVSQDNMIEGAHYSMLTGKLQFLESYGNALLQQALTVPERQEMNQHMTILSIYRNILFAYQAFFRLDLKQAKAIIEDLNIRLQGTYYYNTFLAHSKRLVTVLMKNPFHQAYDNGDLMAIDGLRINDFIQVRHWSNCNFMRRLLDSVLLNCLMTNGRDHVEISYKANEARNLVNQVMQPVLITARCKVSRFLKAGTTFNLQCQQPMPFVFRELPATSPIAEPAVSRGQVNSTVQASPNGDKALPSGTASSKGNGQAASARTSKSAKPDPFSRSASPATARKKPAKQYIGTFDMSSARDAPAEKPAELIDKTPSFGSDAEKEPAKGQYPLPPGMKEFH